MSQTSVLDVLRHHTGRGEPPRSDTEPPRTEGPGGTGDRHRRTGAGTAEAGERPPETPDGGTGRTERRPGPWEGGGEGEAPSGPGVNSGIWGTRPSN